MTTTYLYRLLDNEARLLYIGISNSPIYRLFQHLEEKPWAPQIAWQNVKRFDTREEAEQAEESAIRTEKPLYNIRFNEERTQSVTGTEWDDRRNRLFVILEQNGVPKDATLSVMNARAIARQMCGKSQIINFNRADWLAWCERPSQVDPLRIVSGTNA